LRPEVGGVVDVVTRKSRGCARRRVSRRVVGSMCDGLQFLGCNNVVVTRGKKSKGGVAQGEWGGCRGGVVKSMKWEAGLAWWVVRRVEGSSARAQSRAHVSDCDFWQRASLKRTVRHAGEA